MEILANAFCTQWKYYFQKEHITAKFHLLEAHGIVPIRTFGTIVEQQMENVHHEIDEQRRRYNNKGRGNSMLDRDSNRSSMLVIPYVDMEMENIKGRKRVQTTEKYLGREKRGGK
eukprot:gene7432-8219_t